jgi:hypothetical protein
MFTKGDPNGRNMKQIVLRLVNLLNDELDKEKQTLANQDSEMI